MERPLTTVLVTAVAAGGVGEQVLKALRLAGGYRIVGTDVRSRSPQFGLVDVAVTLPPAGAPEYSEALLSVAGKLGVKAIFPGSEAELIVMNRNRASIEATSVLLAIQTPSVIETCMDKVATADFLSAHGFGSPRSLRITQRDDLLAIDWFPVILKPASGGGGSRDVFIAQSPRDLELLGEYLLSGGGEVMVQEYVGTPEEEYTVGVLHDLDGAFINSIGLRRVVEGQLHTRVRVRNRTGRAELGDALVVSSGISHGHLAAFPEVTEQCERIASALGARGPINVQCRLVDGEVRVFEINPRFSGTTFLRAMVGYNEPDVLVRRHVLGEEVEVRFAYESALIMRSLHETIVGPTEAVDWRRV